MEQIEIMPRMEGSGQAGTRELLSTASPILAGLALSPVARGVLAAVATIATAPQDSEAGVYVRGKLPARGLPRLIDNGVAVFPDRSRNIELPTTGFAHRIQRDSVDLDYLANHVGKPANLMALDAVDVGEVGKAINTLKEIPVGTKEGSRMVKEDGVSSTTAGFFELPTRNVQHGSVTLRAGGIPTDMADAVTHEYTHALDYKHIFLKSMMRRDDKVLPYDDSLAEARAFSAGSRANYDETLTNPNSPDFVHPMMSYMEGRVGIMPMLKYEQNMRASYKVEGLDFDDEYVAQFKKLLKKEADAIQRRVDKDPVFKAKLDKATEGMVAHSRVYDGSQTLRRAVKGM